MAKWTGKQYGRGKGRRGKWVGKQYKDKGCAVIIVACSATVVSAAYALSHWL